MAQIGYAPGAFDLFHVGHLNLLKRAKSQCDFLIAGVVSDEVLKVQKGIVPVVPLAERLEIVRQVRYVDEAVAAVVIDKLEIWRHLKFNVFFKGDDWLGTEKGQELDRVFAAVGVWVVYFPYTSTTSSTALRRALESINRLADLGDVCETREHRPTSPVMGSTRPAPQADSEKLRQHGMLVRRSVGQDLCVGITNWIPPRTDRGST